mmetsp:Transcript_2208/g.4968  ORF Transcript_2208/g.4968 Transcript_2208/m.4968 type:complete len:249 (-) Transcript_2208:272-1018(-)
MQFSAQLALGAHVFFHRLEQTHRLIRARVLQQFAAFCDCFENSLAVLLLSFRVDAHCCSVRIEQRLRSLRFLAIFFGFFTRLQPASWNRPTASVRFGDIVRARKHAPSRNLWLVHSIHTRRINAIRINLLCFFLFFEYFVIGLTILLAITAAIVSNATRHERLGALHFCFKKLLLLPIRQFIRPRKKVTRRSFFGCALSTSQRCTSSSQLCDFRRNLILTCFTSLVSICKPSPPARLHFRTPLGSSAM